MENVLRLNSIPASLYDCREGQEREEIVAIGRLLATEYAGKSLNSRLANLSTAAYTDKYDSQLDATAYARLSEEFSAKRLMFAAKRAAAMDGTAAPESMEDIRLMQRDYYQNPVFMRTMASIDAEVIRPLLPFVLSNVLGPMAKITQVEAGGVQEVDITSNEILVFEDSAHGSHKSAPYNQLYATTVTLRPQPYQANATVKFRQMLSNREDLGAYYNSIMAGYSSKIMALWQSAMNTATSASNTKFIPSGLRFSGATSANLISASKAVAMANHMQRRSCMVFGDIAPLSRILPNGTNQDAALTYGLGHDWFNRGYLGTVMGLPTFELTPSVVPGTQNSTLQSILPTNVLYIAGMPGGSVTAPIYIAIEEGTPITIENDVTQSSDMSININVTAAMDVKPIVASKMAVITNA